jgi:hypothetical protein
MPTESRPSKPISRPENRMPAIESRARLFLPGIGKRLTASFSERLIPPSPKHSVGVAQPMPNSRGRCRADFDCRRLELNSADGPTTCR